MKPEPSKMRWRPLRRSLPNEAVELMLDQRLEGHQPLPVHLMLVNADDERQSKTACGGGLGEWITGDGRQVTCPGCMPAVHS